MHLFDYQLQVVEKNDGKEKYNSYGIELSGMDNAIPSWVGAYGSDKEDAKEDFKEVLEKLLSRIDEVRAEVKEIYDSIDREDF